MNANTAPIHNLQIEQSVLAALMTVAGSYAQVESLLTEQDFHATRHKLIFSAIVDLDSKNSPYDAVLVNQWLEMRNHGEASGGEKYLMQLMRANSNMRCDSLKSLMIINKLSKFL